MAATIQIIKKSLLEAPIVSDDMGLEAFIPFDEAEMDIYTTADAYNQAGMQLANIQAGLEALQTFVENAKVSGGLDPKAFEVIQGSVVRLVDGWVETDVLGLESFAEKSPEELADYTLEGIGSVIGSVFNKQSKVAEKVFAAVQDFFSGLDSTANKLKAEVQATKESIKNKKEIKTSLNLSPNTINAISVNGKIDPIKGLSDINKVIKKVVTNKNSLPAVIMMREAVTLFQELEDELDVGRVKAFVKRYFNEEAVVADFNELFSFKPNNGLYESQPLIDNSKVILEVRANKDDKNQVIKSIITSIKKDATTPTSNVKPLSKDEAFKLLAVIDDLCTDIKSLKEVIESINSEAQKTTEVINKLYLKSKHLIRLTLLAGLFQILGIIIHFIIQGMNSDKHIELEKQLSTIGSSHSNLFQIYEQIGKLSISSIKASLNYINASFE